MERFICGSGMESLHREMDPALLKTLGVETPEQLHLDGDTIFKAAWSMAKGGWIFLPFCSTLCCEGLGARPCLTLEDARVKEPPYGKVDELPEAFSPTFPRMGAMLAAMDRLKSENAQLAYSVEGPFALLSSLLPMSRMFAALRKASGRELLVRAENWVSQYTKLAVEHGAEVISYADPVATVDILGEKAFTNIYLPCCKRLLERLRRENPGVVLHLCGKLSQSLLDTRHCQSVRWEPQQPCESYGQALTSYCAAHPEGGMVGQFCLNLLEAKRPYLTEIKLEEQKGSA